MTYGADYIYQTLSNSASLLAYIGTSIYNDSMVPTTEESLQTVNFYRVGNFDGGQEWFRQEWSIDCRAETERDSILIANIIFNELNRKSGTVGGFSYFGVASVGQTLPPIDIRDVYNTPVSLILRRR
jgi:hypothetical protein